MSDGLIILDKPAGMSSARAVSIVKHRLLPRGPSRIKIGHAGTLDPFATGVLILLIGKATRQCERMMNERKEYLAKVRLGAVTATDDPEAEPVPVPGAAPAARERLEQELARLTGEILQRPPVFSALKIGGRPAYDIARKGGDVQVPARIVRVYEIELLRYQWPDAEIRVECGRGTYIRALARDLGAALGTGGYLVALRRTAIGPYRIGEAVPLDRLLETGLAAHLRPL